MNFTKITAIVLLVSAAATTTKEYKQLSQEQMERDKERQQAEAKKIEVKKIKGQEASAPIPTAVASALATTPPPTVAPPAGTIWMWVEISGRGGPSGPVTSFTKGAWKAVQIPVGTPPATPPTTPIEKNYMWQLTGLVRNKWVWTAVPKPSATIQPVKSTPMPPPNTTGTSTQAPIVSTPGAPEGLVGTSKHTATPFAPVAPVAPVSAPRVASTASVQVARDAAIVVDATYGVLGTPAREMKVTQILINAYKNKPFKFNGNPFPMNKLFGKDPAPGIKKQLRIKWRSGRNNGAEKTQTFGEKDTFTIE